MKSLTEHLWFEVPQRRGYLNITDTVEKLVAQSRINVLVQRETPHGLKSLRTFCQWFWVARSGLYLTSNGEFLRHAQTLK